MSSQTPGPNPYVPDPSAQASTTAAGASPAPASGARVGTIVWGLIVLALAALIIIAQLGIVTLNGTYVLIGLMIGAGAALVLGGLLSARKRDNNPTTRKS
ncbi:MULTISPECIES: hypothetical protein [unclassified Arthrobacter]|uniref:hypothetical protein n=1 Tax=unclassified Arthrobacter TaxID=235627 RepID=UPI001F0D8840|nr:MULTISPECIES: hypothetical protein [unclassified Arthrobacter]